MSVINEMLRDLEQRKAPERQGIAFEHQDSLIEPSRGLNRGLIAGAVILVLVAAVAFYGWQNRVAEVPGEEPLTIAAAQQAEPVLTNPPQSSVSPVVEASPSNVPAPAASESLAMPAQTAVADSPVSSSKALPKPDAAVFDEPTPTATPTPSVESTPELTPVEAPQTSRPVVAAVNPNAVETQAAQQPNTSVVVAERVSSSSASHASSEPMQAENPNAVKTAPAVDAGAAEFEEPRVVKASSVATDIDNVAAQASVISRPAEDAVSVAPMIEIVPDAGVSEPARAVVSLTPEAQDQKVAADALRLMRQGKTSEGYRMLVDFLAQAEVDSKSRAVLVNYLLLQNRLAEAGDMLLAAPVETDPDWRQLKARWLVANDRASEAIVLLERVRPDVATYSDYHALLASYYQQAGQAEQAATVYRDLLAHDEGVADWWAGLGLALDRTLSFQEARAAYQRALTLPGLSAQLREFIAGRLAQI